MMMRGPTLALATWCILTPIVHAWTTTLPLRLQHPQLRPSWQGAQNSDDWDGDVNYDDEFPSEDELVSPDPSVDWNAPQFIDDDTPKLGIDIGKMLEPLSEQEAAELKAAATEVINDAIAEGIDEIEKLRTRMNRELEQKRKSMQLASELNAQRESERLLGKIDKLTDAFLAETADLRKSTKLAAQADRSSTGKGVEMGAWGVIGGAAVSTSGSLLGSVNAARSSAPSKSSGTAVAVEVEKGPPSITVVADESQDPYAKALLPRLTEALQKTLPELQINVFKPTATLPLGGDNADCVLLFATSLSDKSSVVNSLDRLLRRTMAASGKVGQPPTQIVLVSTLGTERTNKMPYSMQNLMGRKLDKRRSMEEAVINTVIDRVVGPPLDYTICKFGELKVTSETFDFRPGDRLDGATDLDTAVEVMKQAIALQPAARNATLSCVGQLTGSDEEKQATLDDAFLRLDGPELRRIDLEADVDKNYAQLVEYLRGWADLLAESGKGLTTPVRTEWCVADLLPEGVQRQEGVRLLFLPTATGKNYVSRDDERQMDKQGVSSTKLRPINLKKKEGGIEVVVEVTSKGNMRVRAKRCNYVPDAIIKELSEATILSRLKESVEVWKTDHKE